MDTFLLRSFFEENYQKSKMLIDNPINVCFNVYIKEFKGRENVDKISRTNKAYEEIRSSIFSGKLFGGYPVSEVELAEKLHMSRTPVREALTRLRSEGLLEYIPRKGVIVKQFSTAEIDMAYEFTEALEGKLVCILASKRDELDFSQLHSRIAEMEEALEQGDIDAWVEADDLFHEDMRNLCPNTFIADALKGVVGQIYYTRMLITRVMLDKKRSTQEHREMLRLIELGQEQEARACTESHIRRIRQEVRIIMGKA